MALRVFFGCPTSKSHLEFYLELILRSFLNLEGRKKKKKPELKNCTLRM